MAGLKSNEAINSIGKFFKSADYGDFLLGGFANGIKVGKEKGLKEGVKAVGQKDGKWNGARIAGAYITGSAALRIGTGGGIYQDKNGNTDLIGLPFI